MICLLGHPVKVVAFIEDGVIVCGTKGLVYYWGFHRWAWEKGCGKRFEASVVEVHIKRLRRLFIRHELGFHGVIHMQNALRFVIFRIPGWAEH